MSLLLKHCFLGSLGSPPLFLDPDSPHGVYLGYLDLSLHVSLDTHVIGTISSRSMAEWIHMAPTKSTELPENNLVMWSLGMQTPNVPLGVRPWGLSVCFENPFYFAMSIYMKFTGNEVLFF